MVATGCVVLEGFLLSNVAEDWVPMEEVVDVPLLGHMSRIGGWQI